MASNTSLSSSSSQTVMTNVLQETTNTCTFTCTQNESNITVIVDGGTTGNITFSEVCTIQSTTCNMQTLMETQIQNVLDSMLKQTAFTSNSVLDFNFNNVSENLNIYQYIQNSVSQIVSNTCTFSTSQNMSGNYVYVGGGAKVGNIGFLQQSTLDNVSCIMNTVAQSSVYNQASATGSQSSTILGGMELLLIAVIALIVIGGILAAVFVLGGGLKKLGGGKGGSVPAAAGGGGGLSPDVIAAATQLASQNPQAALQAAGAFSGGK